MVEKLLTEDDVSALIGRAVSTLKKDRVYGDGVPFIKVGRKAMYRQSDVNAYLAALPTHRSTSEFNGGMRQAGGRPRGDDRPSPIAVVWTAPRRDDDRPEPPPIAAE